MANPVLIYIQSYFYLQVHYLKSIENLMLGYPRDYPLVRKLFKSVVKYFTEKLTKLSANLYYKVYHKVTKWDEIRMDALKNLIVIFV